MAQKSYSGTVPLTVKTRNGEVYHRSQNTSTVNDEHIALFKDPTSPNTSRIAPSQRKPPPIENLNSFNRFGETETISENPISFQNN